MNRKFFSAKIKNLRLATSGAACFYDTVRDKYFCANNLTRQQAEKFAEDNDLRLNSWNPGKSCSAIVCGNT